MTRQLPVKQTFSCSCPQINEWQDREQQSGMRHKGTAHAAPFTPLHLSLLILSTIHLYPSVSPPWSPCLCADKQPNYLITFSSQPQVLSHPYANVKLLCHHLLVSAVHGIINIVTLVLVAQQAFLSKRSPPEFVLPSHSPCDLSVNRSQTSGHSWSHLGALAPVRRFSASVQVSRPGARAAAMSSDPGLANGLHSHSQLTE